MIEGLPHDVVAYEVSGTLTSLDYQEVITPMVEEKSPAYRVIPRY